MKKLSKLALNKANIDQMDILKKKQMKFFWGGRTEENCTWWCTVDGNGTPGGPNGTCSNYNDCWSHEDECPFQDYGFGFQC